MEPGHPSETACPAVGPEVRTLALPRAVVAAPETSTEALRFAIRLAVDAGEYDRAAAILDVLRRTTSTAAAARVL
jgi:hypothetical protein